MLCVIKGIPEPENPDWELIELAKYPITGSDPREEAIEQIATFRRRLPELLAELPEKQKAKILKSQPKAKS
jgi:hypothetical protein